MTKKEEGNKKEELKKEEEPEKEREPETKTEKEAKPKAKPPQITCKFCGFAHEKTFDGWGINHEKFSPGGKAEAMFESLVEQPRVQLYIPPDPGERPGAIGGCELNGLKINVLKGVYDIMVPLQVREVIMESLVKTQYAGEKLITSREGVVSGAGPNFTWKSANARLDLKSEYERSRLE